jgi:hypothetical protein
LEPPPAGAVDEEGSDDDPQPVKITARHKQAKVLASERKRNTLGTPEETEEVKGDSLKHFDTIRAVSGGNNHGNRREVWSPHRPKQASGFIGQRSRSRQIPIFVDSIRRLAGLDQFVELCLQLPQNMARFAIANRSPVDRIREPEAAIGSH